MPKRAVRSKKRTHHVRRKQSSFFSQLFTFPKLVVISFVVLTSLFVYQLTLPDVDVKGASTADYILVDQVEGEALANNSPDQITRLVYVRGFYDTKTVNGKQESIEDCLSDPYKFTINGNLKTRQTDQSCYPINGYKAYVVSHKNCNTIKLVVPSGYKVTGYTYSDKTHNIKTVYPGTNTQTLCGGFPIAAYSRPIYQVIDFGIKKK